MKKSFFLLILVAGMFLCGSCGDKSENALKQRALELCHYIPNYGLLPEARENMTDEFYSVLDEGFNADPFSPGDCQMLFFFTTETWREEPDYEVVEVKKTDRNNAIVAVSAKQKIWNNPLIEDYYIEDVEGDEHTLQLERVGNKWLLADIDNKKSEFAEFNAQCRKEQSWIKCMEDYLTDSIAPLYKSADISVPTVVLVCYNCDDSTNMCFWCDYWVFNYNICSDTLMTVSGGNHPGLMTLKQESDLLRVVSFEQAEDGTGHDESLHRIFDDCYVYYEMKKEDGNYPEEYRKKSIAKYALQYNLTINYYKDYGWDAVRIDNQ